MAIQGPDQSAKLEQLATLVFEMARDVKYLLKSHPEPNRGQMGGQTYHPNAVERATEIQTTLAATVELFGKNLQDYSE